MTVKCIPNMNKPYVVKAWKNGVTQSHLADVYGVSRRSIQRVLIEAGELEDAKPATTRKVLVTFQEAQILEVIRKKDITLKKLNKVLKSPAFSEKNMLKYLSKLPLSEFGAFLKKLRSMRTEDSSASQKAA